MLTRKQILKKVNNPKMDLEIGQGYVYFIYDDLEKNIYDTHSVLVPRLNDLSLDSWIYEAEKFIKILQERFSL